MSFVQTCFSAYSRKRWAKVPPRNATKLPCPVIVCWPGCDETHVSTDPYGDPLTYLTPEQIKDLHDKDVQLSERRCRSKA